MDYHDNKNGNLELSSGGRMHWRYCYDGFDFNPHFHPIRLNHFKNDVTVTNNLPGDHPWHQGLMFAWKLINGHNFWDQPDGKPSGKAIHCGIEILKCSETEFSFSQDLDLVTNEDQLLLKEKRTIVYRFNPSDQSLVFDWDIESRAQGIDLEFKGDPMHACYGGLCFRGCAIIVDDYANSENIDFSPPDNPHAKYVIARNQDWFSMTLLLDGIERGPAIPERFATAALIDHPENLHSPTPALVWKHMQKLNMGILNPDGFTLNADETLRLRYRTVVKPGVLDRDWMKRSTEEFRKMTFC